MAKTAEEEDVKHTLPKKEEDEEEEEDVGGSKGKEDGCSGDRTEDIRKRDLRDSFSFLARGPRP